MKDLSELEVEKFLIVGGFLHNLLRSTAIGRDSEIKGRKHDSFSMHKLNFSGKVVFLYYLHSAFKEFAVGGEAPPIKIYVRKSIFFV